MIRATATHPGQLALALHPDKNGAPGADEAFKSQPLPRAFSASVQTHEGCPVVSKAFQVLSDPDKRAAYDRHGADPDSRMASSPFARGGGGPAFRDDFGGGIDPEEIFRTFFGGPGMQFGGASPFGGGGGVYTFQFGGPGGGFRTMPRRGAGGGGAANQQVSPWVQLLPLLVLFAISMVSMLPSLFSFGGSSAADPAFSWSKSQVYPVERTTLGNIGVKCPSFSLRCPHLLSSPDGADHVNAKQFSQHPMYTDFLTSNPSLGFTSPTPSDPKSSSHLSAVQDHLTTVEAPQIRSLAANAASKAHLKVPPAMRRFEQGVENAYLRRLQSECQNGLAIKEERRRRAVGFFGVMCVPLPRSSPTSADQSTKGGLGGDQEDRRGAGRVVHPAPVARLLDAILLDILQHRGHLLPKRVIEWLRLLGHPRSGRAVPDEPLPFLPPPPHHPPHLPRARQLAHPLHPRVLVLDDEEARQRGQDRLERRRRREEVWTERPDDRDGGEDEDVGAEEEVGVEEAEVRGKGQGGGEEGDVPFRRVGRRRDGLGRLGSESALADAGTKRDGPGLCTRRA